MSNEARRTIWPWGATAALLIALVGWSLSMASRLAAVEAKAADTISRVDNIEQSMGVIRGYLQSIDQRTARIEGKLDRR